MIFLYAVQRKCLQGKFKYLLKIIKFNKVIMYVVVTVRQLLLN